MPSSAKEKVSMFCQVDKDHVKSEKKYYIYLVAFLFKVICMPDVKTLYRVPLLLEEEGVLNFLAIRLNLILKSDYDRSLMIKWRDLTER
jgi:CTP synthase (UTP-ammonia lyase)